MAVARKPFQGVSNIIRFNWHFYLLALVMVSLSLWLAGLLEPPWSTILLVLGVSAAASTMISLLASLWVYDLSGLYELPWLEIVPDPQGLSIVNVNAGFDETSGVLQARFPGANFQVLDFYDPNLHTEVSIKRARRALPPFPGTLSVATDQLLLADESADYIFAILSAHEIRDESERARFFAELARLLKPGGRIYVTEHLRDLANLLVYNIGFLHFHSRRSWIRTFETANLKLVNEVKTTPFISTFILQKQA